MPYPDTEATVDEIKTNEALKRKLFEEFNRKPKDGIKMLNEICTKNNLGDDDRRKQLAGFFMDNTENLDMGEVGDYLATDGPETSELLRLCSELYAPKLQGVPFVTALRGFVATMQPPGEAQKIGRVMKAFSENYVKQNPAGDVADADSAYVLGFQAIMLATDAHSPQVKNKMTFEGLQANLRGYNKGGDFPKPMMQDFYKDLTSKNLAMRFEKTSPSYEIDSQGLGKDKTLGKITKELGKKSFDPQQALGMENVTASVGAKKPWHSFLTGYKTTITLEDANKNKVTVQVSKPGIFSKEKPSVSVKPEDQSPGSLKFAGQVASKFQSAATPKAAFAYLRDDMSKELKGSQEGVKPGIKTETNSPKVGQQNKQGLEPEAPKEKVKLSRTGHRDLREAGFGTDLSPQMPMKVEVMNDLKQTLAERNKQKPGTHNVGDDLGLKKVGTDKSAVAKDVHHGHGMGS